MKSKLVSLGYLIRLSQDLRRRGKKIVTYNGSFDLMHVGHIKSLQEAKRQGDVLLVFVNSDESVRSYKGPHRPVVGQIERAELVAGIEGVDKVAIFNDQTVVNILSKIKPQVHCNGSDWGKNCIEREVVEKNGGTIHVLGWEKNFSTSKLIKRIIDTYAKPTIKAIFLDRDGTINDNGEGYIHRKEDFVFLPSVIEALRHLSVTDYKIVIVTNQSGIGRGRYTVKDFNCLTAWMINTLKKKGVRIDKVYHCPHTPDEDCECRKPRIGMFLQAVTELGVSLNDSWLIGDDDRDVIAGRNANIKTIKLGGPMPKELKLEPNHYAKSMIEAVKRILG